MKKSKLKRLLCFMLLFSFLFSCLSFTAAEETTAIKVDPEAGLSEAHETNATGATLGTEVYLFVDPETASHVNFLAVDEEGNVLPNALLYLTYKGQTSLYGSTNKNGSCTMYLFRSVNYGYTFVLDGYETASGSFSPGTAARTVQVILRKNRKVTVKVTDHGTPLSGLILEVEGNRYETDSEGQVYLILPNGVYPVTVTRPDGRVLVTKLVVNGDGSSGIVFEDDDVMVPGGQYSDRMLVYDGNYKPRSYVLTEYLYEAEDLTPLEGESEEEFEQRKQRYLSAHVDTVWVEVEMKEEDADIQRSLMPSGWLLDQWEEKGFDNLMLTYAGDGVQLSMADLHTGNMAKLYALLQVLTDENWNIEDIVTAETLETRNGLKLAGLKNLDAASLDLSSIDFSAIRDFAFARDADDGQTTDLLPDTMFTGSGFEVRLTPITLDSFCEMVLATNNQTGITDIILGSTGYYSEEARKLRIEGNILEEESSPLFEMLADDRLTEEELEELRQLIRTGTLTEQDVRDVLAPVVGSGMYSVSCWLTYQNFELDVTAFIPSLQMFWNVDAKYAAEYERQLQQLMLSTGLTKEEVEAKYRSLLDRRTKAELIRGYGAAFVSNSEKKDEEVTRESVLSVTETATLEDEFQSVVMSKNYRRLTVKVTETAGQTEASGLDNYEANVEISQTQMEVHYTLNAGLEGNSLAVLLETEEQQ